MRKFTRLMLAALAVLIAFPAVADDVFKQNRTDFRDETIYFAMTTRFYDGDPKNNVCCWDKQDVQMSKNDPDWRGDFAGLIKKLDYIKALGFTAIWITPIVQNASGEDYHGYHAMDFSNVDVRYESRTEWGSAEDVRFQDLIEAAHKKDIKIVLDIVLQHTSNFGEVGLNPLFTRSQDIRNQANVGASVIPNYDRLPSNYNDLGGEAQYAARFKYFKNPEYDKHNYYHHYGTGWNWDLPNRWWGQIAGDCVDLNTENNTVAEYLVKWYGEFIKMGVDGFRIDTTGHIAPLTFNKQFIPKFIEISERPEVKKLRLNGCPFFMFGECCQRYSGTVVYRDQPNLSGYFYTWQSDQNLLDKYDGSQAYWDTQVLPEGHDSPVGPMAVCHEDSADKPRSNNAWLENGKWHQPDYSKSSNFSVIDFPMHYNFNSAREAFSYNRQDNYYNDATFNVVYVDSHDYCPGPNDGTRFNGGTAQWAENLSLMFTFRGIPCIYYGSEVEFKKGKPIDVGGNNNKTPRSESGRAYFGAYLEGEVYADDFCDFTTPDPDSHVAKTLNGDLAQHIRHLNQIRMAVSALRKGQYTTDGCQADGGIAFKRAYKEESYALVALNGGATFTGVPAGTYVDVVTGDSYDGNSGTVKVTAPNNQGQVRVLVKGWTKGRVGEYGKFIYKDNAVSHGGNVEFDDPGTPEYYTAEDAPGNPEVKFSPAGGSFRTESVTVTATANSSAVSAWYQVAGKSKVTLTANQSSQFTVGEGISAGQSVSVSWGAKGSDGKEFTGTVTYKKVDPSSGVTIYVTGKDGADISGTNLHVWDTNGNINGDWPGKKLTDKVTVNVDGVDREFYYQSFDQEKINIIFNRNGAQTANIEGIEEDTYFEYDGGSSAKKLTINPNPVLKASMSPAGGEFNDTQVVKFTVANSTSAWYQVGNGAKVNVGNGTTSFTIGNGMNIGQSVTVSWYATDGTSVKQDSYTFTKVEKAVVPGYNVYLKNTKSWSQPCVWIWDAGNSNKNYTGGSWPGAKMTYGTFNGQDLYKYSFNSDDVLKKPMIIFNPGGDNGKTGDLTFVNNAIYDCDGNVIGEVSGVDGIFSDDNNAPVEYYNLQGIRVEKPTRGAYIRRQGSQVSKVLVP